MDYAKLDKELEKAILKMDLGRGQNFSSLFEDFLDLALCPLCNNPNERQIELWKRTQEDEKYAEAFIEAMERYGEAACDYHDPLGEMFMMNISNGQNGQFFTPDCICDLLSMLTVPKDGDSVCDPTCGSGRILLAALRNMTQEGREPWLYGNDLSYTCARMTLLNLLVNRARGEVSCGDALKYDLENYTFFKIDRCFMPQGFWISTYWQYTLSNVSEIDTKRNAWRLEMLKNGLWVELPQKTATAAPKEPIIEKETETELPTTAKAVEGQYQLELF